MPKAFRALLLSAPVGAGHKRAASALAQAFAAEGAEARQLDVFELLPPLVQKAALRAYPLLLARCPAAYAGAYAWGNGSRAALWLRSAFSRYLARALLPRVDDWRPDALIAAHATPAGAADALRRAWGRRFFSASVVTDFVVHRLWVYPATDAYFIARKELSGDLRDWGVAAGRAHALGIPVDARFSQLPDKREARLRLGIAPQARCVLLMGGGAGLLPMEAAVRALDALPKPPLVLAVAGQNAPLQARLRALEGRTRCELRAFGFVDCVPELMAASDLLISKAGGLTASEALSASLPLLVYRPLPGQEAHNAAALCALGAAEAAQDAAELAGKAARLLADGEARRRMAEAAQRAARPQAARDIARAVLALAKRSALDAGRRGAT